MSGGDGRTPALVRLSAALAARAEDMLEARLRALASAGPAVALEVEETLLQSYLFLGYPAALNALALWRRLSGRASGPASAWYVVEANTRRTPGRRASRGRSCDGSTTETPFATSR